MNMGSRGEVQTSYTTNAKKGQDPVTIDNRDMVKVIQTKFKKLVAQNRQCGCTAKWLFYVRRGEVKAIKKETVERVKFEKTHIATTVMDIAIQPDQDSAKWEPDVFAVIDNHGTFYVATMNPQDPTADYEILATASIEGTTLQQVSWLTPKDLMLMAKNGSLWHVHMTGLQEEFRKLNPTRILSTCPDIEPVPVPFEKSDWIVSVMVEDDRVSDVAYTCNPNDSSKWIVVAHNELVPILTQSDNLWAFFSSLKPDDTPVKCVAWMGSEVFPDLYSTLAILTNEGRSLWLYNINLSEQIPVPLIEPFHKVDISAQAAEWTIPEPYAQNPKWILESSGDTLIITAMGLKMVVMVKLKAKKDGPGYDVVVNDWVFSGFMKANQCEKNKSEEVLLSMVVPAYKGTGEKKPLEMCLMSTHQLATCKGLMEIEANVVEPPAPAPAQASAPAPTPIPTPAPPSTVPPVTPPTTAPLPPPTASTSHEVMAPRQRKGRSATPSPPPPPTSPPPPPAPTVDPLPPFSAPTSTPSTATELGNSLHHLQATLQSLQGAIKANHERTNEKIDGLEVQLTTYRQALDSHHTSNLKLVSQQSSDLQRASNTYYRGVEANIRTVQSKIEEDTVELGKFLKAPTEKMMLEMSDANKQSLEGIRNAMEGFGSDMFDTIVEEITDYQNSTPKDTREVARAFNEELKGQLSAMLEKRWEEICNFQVMLELDYIGICKDIEKHLQQILNDTRTSAAREVGRQLGDHTAKRAQMLQELGFKLDRKFEAISQEIRGLSDTYTKTSMNAAQRTDRFLDQQDANPTPVKQQHASYSGPRLDPSDADFYMEQGRWSEAVDAINNSENRDLLYPKFRTRYQTDGEIEQILEVLGTEQRIVLLRDVFVNVHSCEQAVSKSWLVRLLRKLKGTVNPTTHGYLGGILSFGLEQFSANKLIEASLKNFGQSHRFL